MSAPYVSPLGDIVYDDMNDCVDEASFHVAVAPDLRLQMQARIMAAASLLKDRPVTKDKFYAAAWIAEDAHLQCLAWPIEYEVLYISVLRRCWAVVEASQKPMVVS